MLHASLLPPLLPLGRLPLPALLSLQPLCQELLMPAGLLLPLILQLHQKAPGIRHQPLEALRQVLEDGFQAAGLSVAVARGEEDIGAWIWGCREWRGSGLGKRGRRRCRWRCYYMWGRSVQAVFQCTYDTGYKTVQV